MTVAHLILLGLVSAVIDSPSASALSIKDLSAGMRKDVTCMRDALEALPGIDHARVGVINAQSWGESGAPAWVHPVIDYRYTEKTGNWQALRFEAHGSPGNYYFMVVLSGLASPGKSPNDWGTNKVIDVWEKRFGVSAAAFSV